MWLTHEPGGRLPLLSTMPMVSFPAEDGLEPATCKSQVRCPTNSATESPDLTWWYSISTLVVNQHHYYMPLALCLSVCVCLLSLCSYLSLWLCLHVCVSVCLCVQIAAVLCVVSYWQELQEMLYGKERRIKYHRKLANIRTAALSGHTTPYKSYYASRSMLQLDQSEMSLAGNSVNA